MQFTLRTFIKSFQYAWKGLLYIFRHEQNFRIQCLATVLVCVAMIFFRVTMSEAIALILMALIVLILEILNTVVEKFIDLLQPRMHHYSKIIKDMMAAAVLLAAIVSCIIGAMIFFPYIVTLFS